MTFPAQRILTIFMLFAMVFLPSLAGAQILTGYGQEKQAQKQPLPDAVNLDVDKGAPVDFTADSLEHDETGQIITARGHVELAQAGRILKADEVIYNLSTDTVMARGHIVLLETNGDIHFADEVELRDGMKSGFVTGMHSYLTEGGHFVAQRGVRDGNTIVMSDASYTPCECDTDEEGDPAWQISADTVTYHEAENRISYKNAKFEIFGIPLGWLPFMSHPDGKVKQKSGVLAPQAGFDSDLGLVVTSNYYWALGADHDLTTGVMAMTNQAPVGVAEYRRRFQQADLALRGSTTYSDRTDSVAGVDVKQKDEWRGHLFADARWDINDKWRAGTSVELTSDDQYLRQYDFSNEDVLENEVFVERFSGRNYVIGRVLAFQDVRVQEQRTDQPNVLPEVMASFIGEPNALLGGRWALDLSLLGLERDGNGQDMNRIVAKAGWQKRVVTDFGLVSTLDATVRGDAYMVRDNDIAVAGSGRSTEGTETRAFPQVHLVSSYPVAKPLRKAQAVIEPIVALTAAPHVKEDSNIPNEDSQDVQLDASNLFEPSRFPGFDKLEDGVHATYGIRTGLYGYEGQFADLFVGQSYRFNERTNPFPDGSGLSEQESDFVGQFSAGHTGHYGLNYRFQLNNDDFGSRRHELDAFAKWDRFSWNTRYLFAKGLEGTELSESREQINNGLSYRVTRNWRMRASAQNDLGDNPGLRRASVGFDYSGCCLSFSANAVRNLTDDSSGDSGTDITFRLGLKGLGDFQSGGDSWGTRVGGDR